MEQALLNDFSSIPLWGSEKTDVSGVRHAVIIAAGNGLRFGARTINRPKPLLDVLGIPLIERTIRNAQTAGIDRFTVITGFQGPMIEELLSTERFSGVEIKCIRNENWHSPNGHSVLSAKGAVPEHFILLMSDHLFEPGIIQKLLSRPLPHGHCRLAVDYRPESSVDMEDATKVKTSGGQIIDVGKELSAYEGVDTGIFLCSHTLFEALEDSVSKGNESLSDGVRELAGQGRMEAMNVSGMFWQDVDNECDMAHGERRLLQRLGKERDSWLTRNINRRISLFVTRRIARTGIRPNQITLFNLGLGLLGSASMIQGTYEGFLMGALLFLLSSILDGCDGEIARLKFQKTPLGGWLDVTTDNVTHLALFSCMTAGVVRSGLSDVHILLGMLLVSGSLFSFLMTIFGYRLLNRKKGPLFSETSLKDLPNQRSDENLSAWLDRVANRDFAYLILFLALIGRLHWFLWIAGIGAPLFGFFLYRVFSRQGSALQTEKSQQAMREI
jgi:CDP-L-myo-inositol myo-inositolphosphotransferase